MAIPEGFVEAILLWSDPTKGDAVEGWFAERGLGTRPMKAGLLVHGDLADFAKAFHTDLRHATAPVELDIPEELSEAVSTLVIRQLPHIHN